MAAITLSTARVTAQQTELPPVTQERTSASPVLHFTPSELIHRLATYRAQSDADQPFDAIRYPLDSMRAAKRAEVARWLTTLDTNQMPALERDLYGRLLVVAGQDAAAQSVFARRLASPGLTAAERAFLLLTAVRAFADVEDPRRAERYAAALDSLPDAYSWWQFRAHESLANLYARMGNSAALVTHGERAYDRLPHIFFANRYWTTSGYDPTPLYVSLVEALRNLPDGAARIAQLDQQILATTTPPPSEISPFDMLGYAKKGTQWARSFHWTQSSLAMLDQPAPVVQAQAWLHVPDTTAHDLALNDGVIRVIAFGPVQFSRFALTRLGRIVAQFPHGVQALYLMETQGYWGTAFVTPQEEIGKLRTFFATAAPTVPIAIWAGEKRRTREDGMVPVPSPTIKALRLPNYALALVDGQGRIRRIFTLRDPADERQVVVAIARLLTITPRS